MAAATTEPGLMHELDTSGLRCPLPVLRARKRLQGDVAPGECLRVLATDPAAPNDFRAFCEAAGHALVASERRETPDGPVFVLVIRRRPA
jgi:tRNA 2-thiouridine synthesizing protein A